MENSPKQVTVTIDGHHLSVPEGMTILEAARKNSIRIPTLCHHPALSAWGGCRLCMVEVDGSPKLVASCVMPVREGMAVVTSNEAITLARRTILEFLFAERNHYCMFCSQSGDCELQALAYELQMDHLTVPQSYASYPVDITSEYMAIDHNRCVLCGRCVRACAEIAGAYVLNYQNRGIKNQIAFDMNASRGGSSCLSCGACLQLCPTGAIINRYRSHRSVKGHEKTARKTMHDFCSRCGLMCETDTFVENNQLVRIDGIITPGDSKTERGQLCVKGRFEPLKTPGKRLLHPMMRDANGTWKEVNWKTAMDRVERKMNAGQGGTGAFGLISGQCANEQLMIFRDLMQKGWAVSALDTLDGRSLSNVASAWKELSKNFLAFKEASWRRILDADHILVAGSFETQPLIGGLVRRAILEKRSTVSVLGSCDALSSWCDHHVPVAAGAESLVTQAFLSQASQHPRLSSGWKPVLSKLVSADAQRLLNQAGLEDASRLSFMAAVDAFVQSKNPMVIAGNGVIDQAKDDCLRNLMLLSLIKGILPENALRLVILKHSGNSAGALKLGIPAVVRNEGWQRGLMLLDDENLEGASILDQLKGLDFLAVITPYFPEALKELAHVLIPRPVGLEEDGTYTSLDGQEIRTLYAILRRPKGVSESWQTLLALMQRTDFHPSYARWKDISARVVREMQSRM
jgi:formate dehydrogenase major subunit